MAAIVKVTLVIKIVTSHSNNSNQTDTHVELIGSRTRGHTMEQNSISIMQVKIGYERALILPIKDNKLMEQIIFTGCVNASSLSMFSNKIDIYLIMAGYT